MMKARLLILLMLFCFVTYAQIDDGLVNAFVKDYARHHEVDQAVVKSWLASANFQPSIIEKMERPAEDWPWHRYRKLFMTEERIAAGVNFWNEYQPVLEAVSKQSGVDPAIIIGILGVETFFGQRKGTYRVLDALYTLAFGYPKRANFFRRELEEFLLLVQEEQLSLDEVQGSYAGAMGYAQFMPSSYRAYAISFDVGGTRDLIESPEDAISSIGNYLKVHRWKKGESIAVPALVSPDSRSLKMQSVKPKNTVSYYEDFGYVPIEEIDLTTPATLLLFDLVEEQEEYWFGFHNFYVITRYNHSPLYAMAVFQLGSAIKAERAE